MSGETTEIVNGFSIDGPIGLPLALCIGVVLALTFGWMLWSQRRAIRRWAPAFWVLRVVAAGLVLWMLLGPTWVTRQRITTPQSVAILVDTSGSMDVSDPPDGPRQRRWAWSAAEGLPSDDPVIHCDRAAVSIHTASHRCRTVRDTVHRNPSSQTAQQQLDLLSQAVERSVEHLESALAAIGSTSEESANRTQRLLTLLQGQIAFQLRDLSSSLNDTADATARDLAESLLTVEDSLAAVERRLRELTRGLERRPVPGSGQPAADSMAGLSRRDHVARTLNAVQQLADQESDIPVSIQPVRFDHHAVAASLNDGWDRILQSVESAPAAADAEKIDSGPVLTNISAALDQLSHTASAESIRAAILITDGAHNDSSAVAPQEVAATLGNLPVHVIPIGQTRVPRDLLLHRVDVPTVVVENDAISIDVIVTAFQCAGETSRLVLRHDGQIIDEQLLQFTEDRTDHRTFFQVPADELGRHEFELSLKPVTEEANTTNNVTRLTVNVVRDTLRVLVADHVARWEYR